MKLGLLSDIYEEVGCLRRALSRFASEGVDQVVFLGDLFATGGEIDEVCRLLEDAGAIGMWGNHDFGWCGQSSKEHPLAHGETVRRFMSSLHPQLEIADCDFAHVEPWLNPEVIEDLWFFEGPPENQDRLDRIFNAVSSRVVFAGHLHRWMLATPKGVTEWSGTEPVDLRPGERLFVTVGAVCDGRFATFDTSEHQLRPFDCR